MNIQSREEKAKKMTTLRGLNEFINELYKGKASILFSEKRFKQFKEKNNLNGLEFANLLEVGQSTISGMLNGKYKYVSLAFLEKLVSIGSCFVATDYIDITINTQQFEVEELKKETIISTINAVLSGKGFSDEQLYVKTTGNNGVSKAITDRVENRNIKAIESFNAKKTKEKEAKKLFKLMTKKGLSVVKLANLSEVNLKRLYNFKAGRVVNMSEEDLTKIYAVLNSEIVETKMEKIVDKSKLQEKVQGKVNQKIEKPKKEEVPKKVNIINGGTNKLSIEKLVFEDKLEGISELSPLNKYYLVESIKNLIDVMNGETSEDELFELIKKIA